MAHADQGLGFVKIRISDKSAISFVCVLFSNSHDSLSTDKMLAISHVKFTCFFFLWRFLSSHNVSQIQALTLCIRNSFSTQRRQIFPRKKK